MKRYRAYVMFFLLLSCSPLVTDLEVRRISDTRLTIEEYGRIWLDSLCSSSMMGRRSGTVGDSLACMYLLDVVSQMGYEPKLVSFQTEQGKTLRNIEIIIPGTTDSLAVLGAHYDGAVMSHDSVHYSAAEDNGSGTVALLMLLMSLREKTNPRSIICCFWDGEEYLDGKVFQGSDFFVKNMSNQTRNQVLFYFNLDTIGHIHENNPAIYFDYKGDERTKRAAYRLSENGFLEYVTAERVKPPASDYASFGKVGIPFLSLHDHSDFTCEHPNHSINDTPDAISIERLVCVSKSVSEMIRIY